MRVITQEEKLKLTHLIDEGMKVLQDIQDLREGLKDTVGAIADEMDIKPALINKAIRAAHKRNLGEQKSNLSDVEDLLAVIGKKA